jgi:hypothetical protein
MQNLDMKLNIVFCTANLPRAKGMVDSIQTILKNLQVNFSALVIGSTNRKHIQKNDSRINIFKISDKYLPIYKSRNICQSYLKKEMEIHGGIGLVLDDDLEWCMPENHFIELIQKLISLNCDMAFMAVSGDAPIPKEYVRASPLLDVLLEIKRHHNNKEIDKYLSQITSQNFILGEHHHDFYSYQKTGFKAQAVSLKDFCFTDFIKCLHTGKTTTRPPLHLNEITSATGRERGPATIIFDSSVLRFKNIAISHPPYYSRRSDMMMALQAKYHGYRLFNTPTVLKHNRQEEFDTHDPKKLIGDILGYALIESFNGRSCDFDKFILRSKHRRHKTLEIINDTSSMLMLLADWIDGLGKLTHSLRHIIRTIIIENEAITSMLQSIDLYDISTPFEKINSAEEIHECPLIPFWRQTCYSGNC